MERKTYRRVFITLVFVLILASAPSMTVYAVVDPNAETESGGAAETTPSAVTEPEPTPPADPVELTPGGQLTLVDDISDEQSMDKEFLTAITKNGNYFYIIVDRAGNSENVHFLNLVDESDLLALIEEDKATAPAVTEPEPVAPAPVEEEPEPEPEQKSKLPAILALILVLALAGGGYFFYTKVLKPKRGGAKKGVPSDLDEFGFEDDEYGELPYAEDEQDSYEDEVPDAEPEQHEFAVPESSTEPETEEER